MPLFTKVTASDATETDAGTAFSANPSTVNCSSNSTDSSRYNGGIHFASVTVPNGAMIREAFVISVANTTKGDDYDTTWYCEDVDDADDFTATADVTSRTTTTASASFDRVDASTTNLVLSREGQDDTVVDSYRIAGPDISACVQEVVDRGSWASGNDMVVIVKGDSGTNRIGGWGGNASTDGTVLYILYTDDADNVRPVSTVEVRI